MKLMNFRRLDPQYTAGGKTGLSRGARADEDVWREFARDPGRCHNVAEAIRRTLDDSELDATWQESHINGEIEEAAEGRLLTRTHLVRERNSKLATAKREQCLKKYGRLACEVCAFDFSIRYGDRGRGFIECHHTRPVATLAEGQKTHIDDLALVCANCE
jgi:5-methylcytosine-specific restriction protein A